MSGIGYIANVNIPYDFYSGNAISIGNYIYLLGGSNSQTLNYKYNINTGVYTKLTDIPYNSTHNSAVAIGTDIYLLGGYEYNSQKYNYRYDTLTDTYTKLSDVPYNFRGGSAIAIGTDIYLFGSNYSYSYYKYAYKYSTLTDTYTKLTNIPYDFYYGGIATVGNYIYLFGGYERNTYAYKYNTLNDTYTKLTNIPYQFNDSNSVAIGTDIYLLGTGYNGYQKYAYKYNTITDIYTRLNDIPYNFTNGNAVVSNNNIYLLGGENSIRYNCKCNIITYDMNSGKIENVKYVKSNGLGGQFLSDNGSYYPLNSYGTTGGTSTAYTCAISSITSYTDGLEVTILPHTDCGANATLKVNSLGALTIKNNSGETLKAGDIKAGVPVSLVRVGSYFFIRGGGGKPKPNIFVQVTEPTTKDGIWINSNKGYDGITELSEPVNEQGAWGQGTYTKLTDIPYDGFGYKKAVAIGTDIYLFGSTDFSYQKYAYKYNTLNDIYTRLTDIPFVFGEGNVVAIDNDIYLFGRSDLYKYNILNDTYTKLTGTPSILKYGDSIVVIGTDVYIFSYYVHKYDTLTDTYTELTGTPYNFIGGSAIAIGTDIYLFGSKNSSYDKYAYKYNISSNTYTKLKDMPSSITPFHFGCLTSIGTDIYLFGGGRNADDGCKYNINTGVYTDLRDTSDFYHGCAITIGTDIYLLNRYMYRFNIYNINKIIFKTNPTPTKYTTILHNTNYPVINKFIFDNVFLTDNLGDKVDATYYYGNGTSWVQIIENK